MTYVSKCRMGLLRQRGLRQTTQLLNSNLDVMTVYFDAVDLQGHSNGFSPNNPSYITAIQTVDAQVGVVINALKSRPNYANEDWLILVTTDHGGTGTGHGGNSNEERHIWWVASGNNIRHKQLFGQDPGSYRVVPPGVDTAIMAKTPVQADIAVTALHHLLYDTVADWHTLKTRFNLDGKSLLDSVYKAPAPPVTGVAHTTSIGDEKKVYPNPSAGLFTFWFDPAGNTVSYSVINSAGSVVKQVTNAAMGYKLNIDLSTQPAGMYIVRFKIGEQIVDKKLLLTR